MQPYLLIGLITTIMTACQPTTRENNPLLTTYNTPFEVPPFDLIQHEHYLPAFKAGIEQQNQMVDQIITSTDSATFDNTILAFDQSGELLHRISLLFFNLMSSDVDDSLQSIARDVTPLLTRHADNLALNEKLFKRIQHVWNQKESSTLSPAQKRVVEKYYMDFVRNGALLPNDSQDTLRVLNEKISMLCLQFGENLLAETNQNFLLLIDNPNDLDGLPQAIRETAALEAKQQGHEGKWAFTLQKPSWIPFLQYATNRQLREKLYRGYFMRGDNDNANNNGTIVTEIAQLRAQRARLLGYSTHAQWVIEENMAEKPENVTRFLDQLWMPALNRAKNELTEMQQIAKNEGLNSPLQSWDWWFYAEKLRKAKYDLDEAELLPYFELQNVRNGMFDVANKLYGITFNPMNNLPVYHPEVETWEVKDEDGSHLGILYLDYHPRAGKRPGAWCTTFRDAQSQNGHRIAPVVSIVCNFTKPMGDTPALLTWDEVTTIFHEFGHALHALFTDGQYKRTAGVVPRDYVELPSQIMENWASEPQVLRQYAKHYQTGETIPESLIQKIEKSAHFNQGFMTTEYLAASYLDMAWHGIDASTKIIDANTFEQEAMTGIGLISEILPRYRSSYFSHIFDGGYSAGYYVYIWAAVLDADAFAAFKESGDIFNRDLANRFRQHCLRDSGEDEGMTLYRKFRGADPSVEPLLTRRGLK
ncbi:MAG: M3 family metallopeptidase [Marinilabiliaceae bacterium]|nr:M3 family metallopeptidase [Marinilabiliaceae bacterium]